MNTLTDQQLMQALVEGKDQALNELMVRYKQRIFLFIRRYVGQDESAFDLVQETFTRVYFSAHTFNSHYKFSSWLFQIALNLCRDYLRKQKILRFLSLSEADGIENIATPYPDPESETDSRQSLLLVEQTIEALPHKLKSALLLFSIEQLSQSECAEILGISPKAVETRVYRARKILAERLSKKI